MVQENSLSHFNKKISKRIYLKIKRKMEKDQFATKKYKRATLQQHQVDKDRFAHTKAQVLQ